MKTSLILSSAFLTLLTGLFSVTEGQVIKAETKILERPGHRFAAGLLPGGDLDLPSLIEIQESSVIVDGTPVFTAHSGRPVAINQSENRTWTWILLCDHSPESFVFGTPSD